MAFVWNGEKRDNLDIYIKRMDADTPLRLTTDPAEDLYPVWSPDGSRIAFARQSATQWSVYITPPVPNSERKLADYVPSLSTRVGGAFALGQQGLAWSRDGRSVLVSSMTDNRSHQIVAIPLGGGGQRTVLSLEAGTARYPAVSPDGGPIERGAHSRRYGIPTRGTVLPRSARSLCGHICYNVASSVCARRESVSGS